MESRTILVTDDEQSILRLYESCLGPRAVASPPSGGLPRAQVECRLLIATSGEEAVELVRQELEAGRRVAGGFFDLCMPVGIDGCETMRRVRQLDPDVLCTVVSGCEDVPIDEINRTFGADHLDEWDYLAKPFTRWEVVQKCRHMVHSWNRRRREEEQLSENLRLCRDLEALARNLEGRVRQRTRDLKDANRLLEDANSQLRQALDDLQQAQGALVQSEKMASIGQLAAGVAHEINNPIGFVHSNIDSLATYVARLTGYIRHLDDHVLPALGNVERADVIRTATGRLRRDLKVEYILGDLPELIRQSQDGTERIKQIVSSLRTFSHPGGRTTRCDVNDGLRTTVQLVRGELRRTADLVVELGDLPAVNCDPAEMAQVWMNLLINAGHAMEGRDRRGTIRVESACDGGEIVVRITDDGCGMGPDVLSRIFEPFFTTKDIGRGTGLGLSVAYGIVKHHRGQVAVESTPGRGTCFTVRLPAAQNVPDLVGV